MNEPAKATRTQNPCYHVYLQKTNAPAPEEGGRAFVWEQLTKPDQPVPASTRKQAVEKALAARGKPDEGGPFMVVRAKDVWIKSQRIETTKTQVWS